MADLIDRQAAIAAMESINDGICEQQAIDALCELPSAQPEDKCGECDAWNKYKNYPQSAQPEQRWIPCSERLPEDDVEVFVYLFDGQSPYIAWVCDCHWYTEDFEVEKENYPTAWMPLPEPWKGEEHVPDE